MSGETAYLKTLCEISRAFATTEKMDHLLNRIVDSAIDAMAAKAACLFLADEEKDIFVSVAQKGLSDGYMHAPPEKARKQVDILSEAGYLFIKDATTDPKSGNHDAKRAEGIASILVVPVTVHNRIIGVLTLYTATPRDFTETDIAFLTALAEQGGIAIDRARLISQIRYNARIFHDLSAGLSASLNISDVMRMLTDGGIRTLNAKAISIRLLDENENKLKLVASLGLDDAYLDSELTTPDAVITDALKGKTTVSHPDAAEGIVTVLTVPIRVKSDVIGVMRMYYGTKRKFYQDELLMMEALGHQAGLALQNASEYLKLETNMKDLQEDIWSHKSWF